MKKLFLKIQILFVVVAIGISACKKNGETNKGSGICFLPLPKTIYQKNEMMLSSQINNNIRLGNYIYETGFVDQIFSYSIPDKKLVIQKTPAMVDSNYINGLVGIESDNFIGISSDITKQFTFNGRQIYPDKLVLLDKDLNILKQKFVGDTSIGTSHFTVLGDGKYLIIQYPLNLLSYVMVCFNDNLDILWRTSIPCQTIERVCYANNSVYVLEPIFNQDRYYLLYQYGMDGKYIGTKASATGNFGPKMVKTDIGLNVFSLYNTPDKRSLLGISVYNKNMDLLQTKLLNTSSFSFSDAITFTISSPILNIGNNFYFTVGVDNYSSLTQTILETKLVKVNSKLEIEWAKTLDENRKTYDVGYLESNGTRIVNIGKSIWNGIEGLSFIQTDMDGNIVK